MNRTAPLRSSFLLLPFLVVTAFARAQTTEAPQPLLYDTPMERELSGGQKHIYQAQLEAGQYLRVVVAQNNCPLTVAVIGPGGQHIFDTSDSLKGAGAETISFSAEVAGRYQLELRLPEKLNLTGQYVIRAEPPRRATAGDQSHAAAVREMAAGDRLLLQRTTANRAQAREKYQAALSPFRQTGDRHGEAAVFYRLGVTYQTAISTPKEAFDSFSQALNLYRELGDRAGQTATFNRLGTGYVRVGDFPQAFEHLNQALALSRELNDPMKEADALHSFGAAYYETGDYRRALAAHNKALQLRTALGEKPFALLANIGVDYVALGEYQQALEYYQQSVNLARAAGNRESEVITLNNMGVVYRRLGDEQQALDAFQQALAYWRDMNNLSGQAQVLNNIGNAYRQMMEYPKALEHYTQALAMFRQIGSRGGEATALNNLGYISYVQERYQEAMEHYSQAHRLRKAGGDRHGVALSLNRLGQVWWRKGEHAKALEALNESLRLHRELNASYDAADVLLNLAAVERDQGKLNESLTTIEAALKLTESQRATLTSPDLRASFVAAEQEKYQFYIDLLMRLNQQKAGAGHDVLAFQAAERARARVLLESLVEARLDLREGIDPALLERERAMQKQIHDQSERLSRLLSRKADEQQLGAVRKELERLTTEYQKVEGEIRKHSPRYAALMQPAPLGLKEIQQRVLDDDTLLLEYALDKQRSYLWAVTKNSLHSFTLAGAGEIEAAARRLLDLLPKSTQRRYRRETELAAAELSRLILKPAARHLAKKRLLIVADGPLQYVPFAALPLPDSVRGDETLLAGHEIISLPSASVLAEMRSELSGRKPAEREVAVFADPVFQVDDPRVQTAKAGNPKTTGANADPSETSLALRGLIRSAGESGVERFERLPYVRHEADAITSLFPKQQQLKALDFTASRATALDSQLDKYRVIHFATHGLLNSRHPDLSGIVLSLVDENGKPQDGFLRLNDLYNLKLNADLVVLSACSTALGREIRGEGLISLTRGFMYAGAARVVASLWNVNDAATTELMKRFYRAMLVEKLTPAAALRAAQLAMSHDPRWSAPYYWSGFVLQGEWK